MKTSLKLTSICCALLLFIFSCFSFGNESGATKIESSPESVVQHFYADYLAAWNDPDVGHGLEKSQSAIDSFTTKHLQKLKSQDDSGADYFTNVQDICPEWVNEISTKVSSLDTDKAVTDKAVIELMLGHSESESKYKINLVRAKGKWLIDSVLFVSNATGHCSDN